MEEKKVNYWKWAFFVLVGILFISGCYLATKVTSQTKEQTNIAKVSDKNSKQKYTSVDVTLLRNKLMQQSIIIYEKIRKKVRSNIVF